MLNTNRLNAKKYRQYPGPRSCSMYSVEYSPITVASPVTNSIHSIDRPSR